MEEINQTSDSNTPEVTSRKSKLWIWLVATIIILLIIVGIYLYFNMSKNSNSNLTNVISESVKQEIQKCNELEIPRNPILCIINIAVKNTNSEVCNQLGPSGNNKIDPSNVPMFKAYCLGMVNKNIDFCNKEYKDNKNRINCIDGVASANLDVQLCKQVEGGLCMEEIAIRTKNANVCKEINFSNTLSYDVFLSECYNKVALITKNSSLCELIKVDPSRKNFCITDIARITNDRTVCDKLVSEGSVEMDNIVKNNCKTLTLTDPPSIDWINDY